MLYNAIPQEMPSGPAFTSGMGTTVTTFVSAAGKVQGAALAAVRVRITVPLVTSSGLGK
ncbi:hypothetical protein DSECCO2_307090 [anaerobic digester metagenome]